MLRHTKRLSNLAKIIELVRVPAELEQKAAGWPEEFPSYLSHLALLVGHGSDFLTANLFFVRILKKICIR